MNMIHLKMTIFKKKSWKGKLFIQMLKKNNDNVDCLLSGRLAVTVFFPFPSKHYFSSI